MWPLPGYLPPSQQGSWSSVSAQPQLLTAKTMVDMHLSWTTGAAETVGLLCMHLPNNQSVSHERGLQLQAGKGPYADPASPHALLPGSRLRHYSARLSILNGWRAEDRLPSQSTMRKSIFYRSTRRWCGAVDLTRFNLPLQTPYY